MYITRGEQAENNLNIQLHKTRLSILSVNGFSYQSEIKLKMPFL